MRNLSPNYSREDGLETVLEVPMPEETFGSGYKNRTWNNVKSCLTKPTANSLKTLFGSPNAEIQMLLGAAVAPLIPFSAVSNDIPISKVFKNQPIEAAMAKYIVKQYKASAGGDSALNSIRNMYAMGKMKMGVTELCAAGEESLRRRKKMLRAKNVGNDGEMGGFVLWQKGIDLWSLELVVSDLKLSAGSDGKLAWRQTPFHTHREPPRPLRRFLQGIDPKSTAELFGNSICIGEKKVDKEDCFVLKLDAEASRPRTTSKDSIETVRHTIWGCFSQRTGLLVQLEDTQLLKTANSDKDSIFWETTTVTQIQDYRTVDGVLIAHKGKTNVSLSRFGERSEIHSRTRMEESWEIEEVGFNVEGLSTDCFLPPSDLNITEEEQEEECLPVESHPKQLSPWNIRCGSLRFRSSKVNAINYDEESTGEKYGFFLLD